jgi:hypothetical protein
MLLITVIVELRVGGGRSRKRAGSPQALSRRPCCAVALRRTAWSEHGMGAAWHGKCESDSPHCVKQIGKTHSKPLAARHYRRTAWARHAICESAFGRYWKWLFPVICVITISSLLPATQCVRDINTVYLFISDMWLWTNVPRTWQMTSWPLTSSAVENCGSLESPPVVSY